MPLAPPVITATRSIRGSYLISFFIWEKSSAASRSRSGVNGVSRIRTPTASNTALAIAAAVGPWVASPTPRNGSPGRSSSTVSTAGTSRKRMIG